MECLGSQGMLGETYDRFIAGDAAKTRSSPLYLPDDGKFHGIGKRAQYKMDSYWDTNHVRCCSSCCIPGTQCWVPTTGFLTIFALLEAEHSIAEREPSERLARLRGRLRCCQAARSGASGACRDRCCLGMAAAHAGSPSLEAHEQIPDEHVLTQ